MREIFLPCHGIVVKLDKSGGGSITSDLDDMGAGKEFRAGVDAIESMVLSHACAGIEIHSPAYIEGIETVINKLADRFG